MKKILIAAAALMLLTSIYAYIPEDTEENSFDARVVTPFNDTSTMVEDGIKAIRQEIVNSTYDNKRTTQMGAGGLEEKESGEENVTSKEVLYFEPKEEIYEAKEIIDEAVLWMNTVYRTTKGDDVATFKLIKKTVAAKAANIAALINALKYEKDNKNTVLELKLKIAKNDKDMKKYMKRLKGKIALIKGKPMPESVE
jgi:hypothetical protein